MKSVTLPPQAMGGERASMSDEERAWMSDV